MTKAVVKTNDAAPVNEDGEVAVLKPGDGFPHMKHGKPDTTSVQNVQHFLNAAGLRVWYDEFSHKEMISTARKPGGEEITEPILLHILGLAHAGNYLVSRETLNTGLKVAALKRPVHPVLRKWERNKAYKWDGKPRLDTWLIDYLGADDTPLNRAFGRLFLIGAVRRVKQPGYLVRHVLVLEGEQHLGKSQALRALAMKPEWFTDNLEVGSDPKITLEQTAGKLIVEYAELSGMAKRDVERVKADISKTHDRARTAYASRETERPRQFVAAATTNDATYLKDKTGNSRFWCVRVRNIKLAELRKAVPQLWAEAVVEEAKGEKIYLTGELARLQEAAAQERTETEPLEDMWIEYFEQLAADARKSVTTEQMYRVADIGARDRKPAHKKMMAAAAKAAGWTLKRLRDERGVREYRYVKETPRPTFLPPETLPSKHGRAPLH